MFHYKRTLSLLLFTILFLVQPSASGVTAPLRAGELDPSFGQMGRLISNIELFPYAAVLQSDGKILIAGRYWTDLGNTEIWLLRFYPDGQLDDSFGAGGHVTTEIASGISDAPSTLAIQPDGKILISGNRVLLRYLPDGKLDPFFGQDGISSFDLGYGETIVSMQPLPDGRILVAGLSAETAYSNRIVLARFLPDGKIDRSFGNEGKTISSDNIGIIMVKGLLLLPDNRFLVGGQFHIKQGKWGTFLRRFQPDGYPDESFGIQGQVSIERDLAHALYLQPDGKIITAGTMYAGDDPFGQDPHIGILLTRFTPAGSLDPSFGLNGKVTPATPEGQERVNAIEYQPDGKILVLGSQPASGENMEFLLRRYQPDGSLDMSFGSNAKVTTDFINFNFGQYLLLYPDGRILAVGSTIDNEGHQVVCAARYRNDLDSFFKHIWIPFVAR